MELSAVQAANLPGASGAASSQLFAGQPPIADQARLERLLTNEVAGATEAPSSRPVADGDAAVTHEALGDAILRGIESIKNQYDNRADLIEARLVELNGGVDGLQDVMRVQFELMQLNMQQELTSKLADKTSQGVQTLFRNQG